MRYWIELVENNIEEKVYYHGTSTIQAAREIKKNGIVPPNLEGRNNFLTPVQGKTYLTPSISYALIYAVGGNFIGNTNLALPYDGNEEKFKYIFKSDNRYGYIFEVSEHKLSDIQPDEDEIGELYHYVLNGEVYGNDIHSNKVWKNFNDSSFKYSFKNLMDRVSTTRQKEKIKDGEYIYYAHVGKKALKVMPNDMKQWLVGLGVHVANDGKVIPDKCWKFDKSKIGYINRDMSNIFDYLEEV